MNDDTDQEWTPEKSSLQLKHRKEEEQHLAPPPPVEVEKKKKKKRKPGQDSGRFAAKFLSQSIGSFLLGLLFFGAFIYHQVNGLEILTSEQAAMTRGIAVIAFFVILVIEAFREDLIQGVLCVFLPPYAFVFGLLFADAGPLRGLTASVLVFFAAEVFLTPQDALVPNTVTAINEWIEDGQQKLINPDKHEAGYDN